MEKPVLSIIKAVERGSPALAEAAKASHAPLPLPLLLAQAAALVRESGGATRSSASCQAETGDREKSVEKAVPVAVLSASAPPKGGLWAHKRTLLHACIRGTIKVSPRVTVVVERRGIEAVPGHWAGGGAPSDPEKPHVHVRLSVARAE